MIYVINSEVQSTIKEYKVAGIGPTYLMELSIRASCHKHDHREALVIFLLNLAEPRQDPMPIRGIEKHGLGWCPEVIHIGPPIRG